jgi:hypothetical protein
LFIQVPAVPVEALAACPGPAKPHIHVSDPVRADGCQGEAYCSKLGISIIRPVIIATDIMW